MKIELSVTQDDLQFLREWAIGYNNPKLISRIYTLHNLIIAEYHKAIEPCSLCGQPNTECDCKEYLT